jgi:hypothetical protein
MAKVLLCGCVHKICFSFDSSGANADNICSFEKSVGRDGVIPFANAPFSVTRARTPIWLLVSWNGSPTTNFIKIQLKGLILGL